MAANNQPRINGLMVAWANIEFSIKGLDGQEFVTSDVTALDFSDSIEIAKARGAGMKHRGRSAGPYDSEAQLTMFLASALAFQSALTNNGAKPLIQCPFNIAVQWTPFESDSAEILSSIIRGAIITGRQNSNAAGSADATVKVFPLSIDEVVDIDKDGNEIKLA